MGQTATGFTQPTANYLELAPTTPKTATGVSKPTGDSVEQALRTREVASSSTTTTTAASFCAEQAVRAWGENAEVYCLLATLLLNTAVACAVCSSRSGTVCEHGKCRKADISCVFPHSARLCQDLPPAFRSKAELLPLPVPSEVPVRKSRLPPHVWSRCRLAPWPVSATFVSICSHRLAFCSWLRTGKRDVSVMDFDFLLLDRSWARVIQVRLDFRDVRVASAFVDQLEKDRAKISIRSLRHFAPACHCFRNIHRVNRELDVSLFIETAEDLNCSPEPSTWNSLFLENLPSQESNLLQLERRIAERTQRESCRCKSDLYQPSCVSSLSSAPPEATNRFLPAFPRPGLHIVRVFMCTQPIARLNKI